MNLSPAEQQIMRDNLELAEIRQQEEEDEIAAQFRDKQAILERLNEGGDYIKYVRLSNDFIRVSRDMHRNHSRMVLIGETPKSAGYCRIRRNQNGTFRGCCGENSMTLKLWPADGDIELIFAHLGINGVEDQSL